MQFEGQHVTTTGWEFLLPSHRRMRLSTMGEFNVARSRLSGRMDLVYAQQGSHSEPLYNSEGVVVGTDVRALAFDTLMPGGMLSWQRPFSWKDTRTEGMATVVAYGRVPSNHEWGANGIHHGSFRFEQGNPQLGTEWAMEGRLSVHNGTRSVGKIKPVALPRIHFTHSECAIRAHLSCGTDLRVPGERRVSHRPGGRVESHVRATNPVDHRVSAWSVGPSNRAWIAVHNPITGPSQLGRTNAWRLCRAIERPCRWTRCPHRQE